MLAFRWISGRRPEFVDPQVVAQGEGREGNFTKFWINFHFASYVIKTYAKI